VVVGLIGLAASRTGGQSTPPVTLERIMAERDWIGNPPERPFWSHDGRAIFYYQKRPGEERRDLIQLTLDGRGPESIPEARYGEVEEGPGELSADGRRKVYARQGDIFVKDMRSGRIRQLTRTEAVESNPRFMVGGDRVSFRRGDLMLVRDLESGLEAQAADLRTEKDPDAPEERFVFLKDQQSRLFETLRERRENREAERARTLEQRRLDPSRLDPPFYLGEGTEILGLSLGPRGDRLIVRLARRAPESGRRDTLPNYVTEDGYLATRPVRPKVGSAPPRGERLLLLDLIGHELHELDLSILPAITFDPLKELRERGQAWQKRRQEEQAPPGEKPTGAPPETAAQAHPSPRARPEGENEKPKPRPVTTGAIVWSPDGRQVALQIFSADNKDRWIALVDFEARRLQPLEHFVDEAWINRAFTELDWLKDGSALYFISEASGYAHLYLRSIHAAKAEALTEGPFEVGEVVLSRDGKTFFFTANRENPGVHETYRLSLDDRRIERLTTLGGRNRFILSPDERQLLIEHSTTTRPPELYLQPARPGVAARQLTRTVSEAFTSLPWTAPRLLQVPSRAGRPIAARLYAPTTPAAGLRPAVVFIHGAGYLQSAHAGWSSYYREFMFHTLLTGLGYVVLDMDYRASAGYGRDWRTAIYRRMGEPELEDLEDGVAWLVERHGVDRARVGVYGGSYGGFLTLMALFRKPELFACGAALRPVTDWAHYNQPYTANILNTPDDDPEAYLRSSPIEYAEGLARPLLICHGMQDDNVLFQDSVRLVQRLIELGKEDWELAIYPLEAHGFVEPSSWLDEYRRVLKLFERNLK